MVTQLQRGSERTTPPIPSRLWVYTNFDCNLSCSYCLSSSSPSAPRRELPLRDYYQLVDEAADAGLDDIFLTGGEPFVLPDIFERIEYASRSLHVTVLTNALLLRGPRLNRLLPLLRDVNLTLQVSLDGHTPELHDAYRGEGTWRRTVQALRRLVDLGFRVSIGATETPLNAPHTAALTRFVAELGIPQERFFLRPLTRQGFSEEGLDLALEEVVPELTVTVDGVYWHPQSGGAAHLLSRSIFPLAAALDVLSATYERILAGGPRPQVYRCA
jgi:MoaA/NifB/PqqE/SkfB family radical SAM enzyme